MTAADSVFDTDLTKLDMSLNVFPQDKGAKSDTHWILKQKVKNLINFGWQKWHNQSQLLIYSYFYNCLA